MKPILFFLLLFTTYCANVRAQLGINGLGYDQQSYIQGFIDVKYNNSNQVSALKDSVIEQEYYKLQKFYTSCMPPCDDYLLLFRYGSGSPAIINSASDFREIGPDRIKVNDSTVILSSRERAVLYLILKEVPVNRIFVTKEEYDRSLFFQRLAIPVLPTISWMRPVKQKRKEEDIIAYFTQSGYWLYRVRFLERYKYTMTGEVKKKITRKLKKGEVIVYDL